MLSNVTYLDLMTFISLSISATLLEWGGVGVGLGLEGGGGVGVGLGLGGGVGVGIIIMFIYNNLKTVGTHVEGGDTHGGRGGMMHVGHSMSKFAPPPLDFLDLFSVIFSTITGVSCITEIHFEALSVPYQIIGQHENENERIL